MLGALRRTVIVMPICLLGASTCIVPPDESREPIRWDMESFARVVKPMRQSMDGRLPLLVWNLPVPRGDELVELRENGRLRQYIETLAERGIVLTVDLGWDWTWAGAMATAKTLQEAGRPVHVLIPWATFLETTAYRNCTVWVQGPDASRGGKMRRWPCLPLANPDLTAAWVRQQLQPFKDAGINVDAVWFDDEALPHPYNGCWAAQRSTEECRRHYLPGVLESFDSFKEWVYPFRYELFTKGAAKPIKRMFPGALVGNYGDTTSGTHSRFGLDSQMPAAYANTRDLLHAFRDLELTQDAADRFYFQRLLRVISSANDDLIPGKLSIPYLSQFVPASAEPRYPFPMSQNLYRELMRHIWLRGADSLYLFNLGYPVKPQLVTPEMSLVSVEAARSVYDELLHYRDFLDRGEPMNFAVPSAITREGIWSGLRLEDRCLVRAVTLGEVVQRIRIEVFGQIVELDAPPEGALYLILHNGKWELLGPR